MLDQAGVAAKLELWACAHDDVAQLQTSLGGLVCADVVVQLAGVFDGGVRQHGGQRGLGDALVGDVHKLIPHATGHQRDDLKVDLVAVALARHVHLQAGRAWREENGVVLRRGLAVDAEQNRRLRAVVHGDVRRAGLDVAQLQDRGGARAVGVNGKDVASVGDRLSADCSKVCTLVDRAAVVDRPAHVVSLAV